MAILDTNFALITHPNPRIIGTIIPDIVVEEIGHDQLQITEFPVESGAPISDHAYKRPPEIIMRCGFSNSTVQSEGYVQQVYGLLLDLQDGLQPFNVTTGKRQYSNMMVSSLLVTTDQESEYALNVVVGLKMVIITNTSGGGATTANQALPDQTSAPQNFGPEQPISQGAGNNFAQVNAFAAGGLSPSTPVFQ
jgi:hypothetical protein